MVLVKDGMCTAWYVEPGKCVETTKVSERKLALLSSKTAWNKFTGQLDEKRLEQEARDADRARKKQIKEQCDEMVLSWNIQKQHIEIETPEQVNKRELDRFFEIRKEQEKEREKFVQQVRKNAFIKSGETKNLDSALLLSECLYERSQQKQYNDTLAEYERMDELKHIEEAKEQQKKHIDTSIDEVKERVKKAAEHQKEILMQIKENLERRKAEKAEEYIKGCEDNRNILRHIEELSSIEARQKKQAKEMAAREYVEAKARREAEKLQKIRESEEIDKIYEIYAASKCRIDYLRKEKEKELIQKEIARREIVHQQISNAAAEREAKEQQIINKYLKEMEEKEKEKIKIEQEKLERQRMEIEENHREMFADLEKEKYKNTELEKWEMLNRIKQKQAIKKFEEDCKIVKKEEAERRKVVLLKQIKYREDAAREEREKEILEEIEHQTKGTRADQMFFAYGEECLKNAKDRGRITYPIEKVIAKYKRDHKLGDQGVPKWHCTPYFERTCPSEKALAKKLEENTSKTLRRRNGQMNVQPGCSNPICPNVNSGKCYCEKSTTILEGKNGHKEQASASTPEVHKCEFCVN